MVLRPRNRFMVLTLWFFSILFFVLLFLQPPAYYNVSFFAKAYGKWRGFSPQQASLSKLGQILYLDYDPPVADHTLKVRNYTILTWKYGPLLERRHIYHYTNQRFNPFETCSVKNCRITYNEEDIKTADLVLFSLYLTESVEELPTGQRNPQQIWTFLTEESPFYTFEAYMNSIEYFNGLFNWSMTYSFRMDSDIPIPYGRTIALKRREKGIEVQLDAWNKTKRQDVLVAIMTSKCFPGNHRWEYVKELKEYISVDEYGPCGTLECPGDYKKDCDKIERYKFYLALENSNCDEYITEKVWWYSFAKNAIPIVMGGSETSYRQFLPPNSYIHVENFTSPMDLADYIIYLNKNSSELEQYFDWKKYFKVVNEHGLFQTNSVHYCRICEALNYNSKEVKVYDDLKHFWNTKTCHKRWDTTTENPVQELFNISKVIRQNSIF